MEGMKIPDELKISLAAARVNAGYTQKSAAKEIGVSNSTIVAWEKGESDIPVTVAERLCDLYNRPLNSIIFGKKSHLK